ncbi:MAG: flagellar FliJ protein [Gammaproteobacteria bacterium]|jgi:flagellar FliJ protein
MTRIERLNPVVKHNDDLQQKALQSVADSRLILDKEQSQLEQLISYRQDYQTQQSYSHEVCSSFQLQEYSRFLAQLDNTIEGQTSVVATRQKELDIKRKHWNNSRIEAAALHKVIEHLNKAEQQEMSRAEQKLLDEFSQRRFVRKG